MEASRSTHGPSDQSLTVWASEGVPLLQAVVTATAERHGFRMLVIKGQSLSYHGLRKERQSSDVDVLLAPEDVDPFVSVMAGLGWRSRLGRFNDYPVRNHSITLVHDSWGTSLDAHRENPGFLLDTADVFDQLWARRESMPVAGQSVLIPDFASSVLILALHSVRSTAESPRHAQELRYLIEVAQHSPPHR